MRCIPERRETLLLQQAQLVAEKRDVQMFPLGTSELTLPAGLARHENGQGAFHYRPGKIEAAEIDRLSSIGRDNEFLNLGPFNKADVAARVSAGEQLVCLVEKSPHGVEIRAAGGTESTLPIQRAYFEATRDRPESVIEVAGLADVLDARIRGSL